jgi:hypothetical protein
MKERSLGQRISKITGLDITSKGILEALQFSDVLLNEEKERVNVGKVIKMNKMRKYKELVNQVKPVVKSFALLKDVQKGLVECLKELDDQVAEKMQKTGFAIRNGKSLRNEAQETRMKSLVIDEVFAGVGKSFDDGQSLLFLMNKVKDAPALDER